MASKPNSKLADLLFGPTNNERLDAFALGAKHAREIRELLSQQSDESSLKRASVLWYRGLCHGGATDPEPEKEDELLRVLDEAFKQKSR
jgi:hypothetical protein